MSKSYKITSGLFIIIVFILLLFQLHCSDINLTDNQNNEIKAEGAFPQGINGEKIEGFIGKDEGALIAQLKEGFINKAIREQKLFNLEQINLDEKITASDLDIPCIKNLEIEKLNITGLKPEHLSVKLVAEKGVMFANVDMPDSEGLAIKGLIRFDNECKLQDILNSGDLGDLGDIFNDILGGNEAVLYGLSKNNPPIKINPKDVFNKTFNKELSGEEFLDLNIFNETVFDSLEGEFDLSEANLQNFHNNLQAMSVEEILSQDIFNMPELFEIRLNKFKLHLPLSPFIENNPDFSSLRFRVEQEGFELDFSPEIIKFGSLPMEIVNIFMEFTPEELKDKMINSSSGPLNELITAELDKIMDDQVKFLKGNLSDKGFEEVFKEIPAENRTCIGYFFDFKDFKIEEDQIKLNLNGLISNSLLHSCVQEFESAFHEISAVNTEKTPLNVIPGQFSDIFLSSNLVNEGLYSFAKSGTLCLKLNLDEEQIVTLTEELISMAVEDLPKVGKVFPVEVRKLTIKALLEKYGILDEVKGKNITVSVKPAAPPRVEFMEGGLKLDNFSFMVRLLFGEVEILRLTPNFTAELGFVYDNKALFKVNVKNIILKGELSMSPQYQQQKTDVPLEQLETKLFSEDYYEFMNNFINKAIEKELADGLLLNRMDLFGIGIEIKNLQPVNSYFQISFE